MAKRQVPRDLAETREKIEEWRTTRLKRGPMPSALWAEAVAMAAQHGTWFASRVLRVNYDSLKARLKAGSRPRDVEATAAGVKGAPAFVEVRPGSVDARPAALAAPDRIGVVIELSSSDGSKLVIRTPAGDGVDVRGLTEAFWRRRA